MTDLHADTHFYSLDALATLPLEDLQTLWESVPPEQQTALTQVFDREAARRQIADDADETALARYFLTQYHHLALVPAGGVWVKVPPAVREAYQAPLTTPPDADTPDAASDAPPATAGGLPRWLIGLAFPFLCLFVAAGAQLLGGPAETTPQTALVPPTETATASPTPTLTPTQPPPTATPLALSGFDDAIAAGQRDNRDYYPVQLQVVSGDGPPRVFIVQQHAIGVAEWRYDPNPDIVSWLGGMRVRPVLGVPFSPANLDLFRALDTGTTFAVTMNTGDVLHFLYHNTQTLPRTQTDAFQQTAPGLVLVLIGETFDDGTPTDIRYLVTARYPPGQEVDRLLAAAPSRATVGETATITDKLTVTITGGHWQPAPDLPDGLGYAHVSGTWVTGSDAVDTAALTPQLTLPAHPGQRLSPDAAR